MGVRTRKFIGAFGLVGFVCAYAVLVVMVSEHLPDLAWVRGVYFAVAGLAWGAPILPLLSWMNRGSDTEG